MPLSTSNSKRKVDALSEGDPPASGDGGRPATIARLKDAKSVSEPDPSGTPHIPAPVWGHVLDYMPYEEVRSALLVGKIIANEAVKYVRTLSFMKSCQLDGPSGRRFPNVEEVNCLSLFSTTEEGSKVLCGDTTIRLVPLLTIYSKIERIFVGGIIIERGGTGTRRGIYSPNRFEVSSADRDSLKALSLHLLGAFKARLLPRTVAKVDGVLNGILHGTAILCSGEKEGQVMCQTCKEICSFFPLQPVYQEYICFCQCASDIDAYETIAPREGARELFRAESLDLAHILNDGLLLGFYNDDIKSKEWKEALNCILKKLGIPCKGTAVWYIKKSGLNLLDRYIAVGFDPSAVPKEKLYEVLDIGCDDRSHDVYAKATFDALVSRGFALDEADLIVLDERMEPALEGLSEKINSLSQVSF